MTQYDFMGKAKLFGLVSAVLFVGSILAMVTLGLRPGIDFTGESSSPSFTRPEAP